MKMKIIYYLALIVSEEKRKAFEANFYAQLEVPDDVKTACQSATSRFK